STLVSRLLRVVGATNNSSTQPQQTIGNSRLSTATDATATTTTIKQQQSLSGPHITPTNSNTNNNTSSAPKPIGSSNTTTVTATANNKTNDNNNSTPKAAKPKSITKILPIINSSSGDNMSTSMSSSVVTTNSDTSGHDSGHDSEISGHDTESVASSPRTSVAPKWQLAQKYSLADVAEHSTLDDCWMVIFDKVYDITEFVYDHPGGDFILMEYAGRDATQAFLNSRHGSGANKMLDKHWIGVLVDEELFYSNNSSYCSIEPEPEPEPKPEPKPKPKPNRNQIITNQRKLFIQIDDVDSFEKIQLESDTHLAEQNVLQERPYSEPSDNDLVKNNFSSFTYADFCPRIKRNGLFRTEFETFSDLFDRINAWLALNSEWRVKSAETIVYDAATDFGHKVASYTGPYLRRNTRGVRLWLMPSKSKFSKAQKIGCINVVPRLKSFIQRSSNSSIQNQSDSTTSNDQAVDLSQTSDDKCCDNRSRQPRGQLEIKRTTQEQQQRKHTSAIPQEEHTSSSGSSPYESLTDMIDRLNELLTTRPI
ncbi:hypothetical protein GZH46_02861, partial [Fragariocoptes setiger]